MAGGLPVIVTENCCVPVPDSVRRVPIMDSTATAQHLEFLCQKLRGLEKMGRSPNNSLGNSHQNGIGSRSRTCYSGFGNDHDLQRTKNCFQRTE